MLKWTVSRSLSANSSTPHGPPSLNKAPRRPFRDLSNTPPAAGTKTRNIPSQADENVAARTTPARRRRCRSHGSDLRTYFQATKPNLRPTKRQSMSRQPEKSSVTESFYQSTPRVDADIGPLTLFPAGSKCPTALTLPTDPALFMKSRAKNFQSDNELPQNIVNEARANLQSHVSDFFQQISMATSPEDVMESDSVPLAKNRLYSPSGEAKPKLPGSVKTAYLPKLARITKIHARCKTPYHTKNAAAVSPFKAKSHGQTPLAGKLSHLAIDQDLPKFENMDNTVTEVLNREQEMNFTGKTVAEILLGDAEERKKVLEGSREEENLTKSDHTYETIVEQEENAEDESARHNDSSVSSASQLLEDPSPMSWAFSSPPDELDGEFTLKRQRGIRRKRHRKDNEKMYEGKRAKRRLSSHSPSTSGQPPLSQDTLVEAVNPNVKKLALETDLDSTLDEKCAFAPKELFGGLDEPPKDEELGRKASSWELDSPKSTVTDDFHSSKSLLNSVSNTPEAPLVATVRRCLKFSPESEPPRPNCHGSIEIEYSVAGDQIHVRVIRCKDLRRAYEGPVHAYVKASLKNTNGEGVVKRTAVHRATPNPVFHETLILPCPASNNHCASKPTSLDIAVWHRDRRARRSELLGCMTLPLPLSQDKEATWHPLEPGTGRNTSSLYAGMPQDCGVSPPLSKDGEPDNNNSGGENLTYLRHLELEPIDPLTGLPLHPGFTARGGRTPCTVTRRLIRQTTANQVPWGFSLSWGRPPRVERVDPGSPAERSGLRPGDHVVFVDTTNVVTRPREEILGLIQAATNQLILEVYRKGGHVHSSMHRPSSMNVSLQQPVSGGQHAVAFNAEVFPNLAPDAPPEEELTVRETRYWGVLKSGHTRFMAPLAERRDVLSAADYLILFQNLDELLKISEEIRDEGGGVDSYLCRVPRITAAYRRYLSGLQRACCLLVALRRNTAFAKLVCEPAVPQKRRPDLTGVLLLPLEHYREMTRLLGLASPRNCQQARDLAQGYREATANAGVMEPPRDTGRPLLSLQEVESRLVFARCRPFTLAMPGRQWLFGGALAKVEGRARLQPSWALLLTDLLVFARVSRDRVLFVTEEPLRLSNVAEACFTVRKRPTEFRLQVAINPNGNNENGHVEVSNSGGCSPHSRPRRRVLVLRAPTPELKAVWHNLLQRQIIYVNTGYGGTPSQDSPEESPITGSNFATIRESTESSQTIRETPKPDEEKESRSAESIETIIKNSREDNHLAQWVRNSHQIPPPDHEEAPIEEWTAEELAARAPKESIGESDGGQNTPAEEVVTEVGNSDVEQQSTASSASLSTVKSNSVSTKKNGSLGSSKENSTSSINICRRCHRSGCPTPPLTRDPFSPLPPKISVVPPTPDLCTKHRLRNGLYDSPGRNSPSYTPADGNTEDGSEDDLDCDGEPPYRALRRFGTMSSLDQDDELEEQGDEENRDTESPPTGLRAWTARASSYVVSKMVLLEQLSEGVGGYLLQPPVPPERTEYSLDPNDEEGTTSGATSGDDIWGTPTSGGPDDESFPASSVIIQTISRSYDTSAFEGTGASSSKCRSPPPNGAGNAAGSGEDNYGLNLSTEDDADQESENEDCSLPELNMDQLLGSGSLSSLRCFLGRRRLEPLPEEEDSPGSGKDQVGWW
ncbi:protostome-specific GEF isoform X1 [Nomia melanderi]|uniref:protostome-specific GEF isoform X1 n=1 Tax=Nomia melanderi TaxID=2448451 RepID=UPI003FCC3E81